MLVALIKAALALAGIGTAVKLLSSSREDEVPPTQAFLVITPQANLPDGEQVSKIEASKDVGKSGGSSSETFEFSLLTLAKGETRTVVVDIAMTAFVGASNKFYYALGGHQFCKGVRLTATVRRDDTGVHVDDAKQESNAEACSAIIDPDVDASLQVPWPKKNYGIEPTVELTSKPTIASADAVSLRVTAPALTFSPMAAEPGKGYDPDWWAQTGPYRYTFRVVGELRTKLVS